MTTLDHQSPVPLRAQLAALLKEALTTGEFRSGDRIPTVRELADQYGVGKTTAAGAIDTLVREGLLSARPHKGTLVTGPHGQRSLVKTNQIAFVIDETIDLVNDRFYVEMLTSSQNASSSGRSGRLGALDGPIPDGLAPVVIDDPGRPAFCDAGVVVRCPVVAANERRVMNWFGFIGLEAYASKLTRTRSSTTLGHSSGVSSLKRSSSFVLHCPGRRC